MCEQFLASHFDIGVRGMLSRMKGLRITLDFIGTADRLAPSLQWALNQELLSEREAISLYVEELCSTLKIVEVDWDNCGVGPAESLNEARKPPRIKLKLPNR